MCAASRRRSCWRQGAGDGKGDGHHRSPCAAGGFRRARRRQSGAWGLKRGRVRAPGDLDQVSGLIIPGGESTTISGLLERWELADPISSLAQAGLPLWGTCAGLIVMARTIVGDSLPSLGLLDVDVQRNAYGRQVDSFEADVPIPAFGEEPFRAVFIRSPVIQRVGQEVRGSGQPGGRKRPSPCSKGTCWGPPFTLSSPQTPDFMPIFCVWQRRA